MECSLLAAPHIDDFPVPLSSSVSNLVTIWRGPTKVIRRFSPILEPGGCPSSLCLSVSSGKRVGVQPILVFPSSEDRPPTMGLPYAARAYTVQAREDQLWPTEDPVRNRESDGDDHSKRSSAVRPRERVHTSPGGNNSSETQAFRDIH